MLRRNAAFGRQKNSQGVVNSNIPWNRYYPDITSILPIFLPINITHITYNWRRQDYRSVPRGRPAYYRNSDAWGSDCRLSMA
ncbi:Tetratricopeptide repeat protein 30-like protein [Frankliniella fusca]|uniref:Tetratricopeptide repeat protein 30-like protein n=1 Tax=Frankliniella fusca TaxID=407009 RepID=A0AAE1GXI1_9NEOP|nr:Tetratricopeptide repeat protein 30-like protein [Frankliniella fusca]